MAKFSGKKMMIYLLILVVACVGSVFGYMQYTKSKKIEKTYVYDMEETMFNLQAGEKSYLKATISLEYTGKDTLKKLDENLPKIKDKIISVINDQKSEDIDTSKEREVLEKKLIKEINSILDDKVIKDILFVGFVLQ